MAISIKTLLKDKEFIRNKIQLNINLTITILTML